MSLARKCVTYVLIPGIYSLSLFTILKHQAIDPHATAEKFQAMLYGQHGFSIAELQPPTEAILYEKFGLGALLTHQDGGFVLAGFVLVMILVMLFPPAHWRGDG